MLFFVTLSILVFNFYPVTAIMIFLLALFNDAPIMDIANDNVRFGKEPEKWNMRVVLTLATFLSLIEVIFSFALFYIGQEMLHLPRDVIQSFLFLKLAVAGHFLKLVLETRNEWGKSDERVFHAPF